MERSEEERIVDEVRRLVEEARRNGAPRYARHGMGASGTCMIAKLAEQLDCEIHVFPFRSRLSGMAFPSLEGKHPLFIDGASTRSDQELSVRHELAHRLMGEVSAPTYLANGDRRSFSERVADVFAIADLAPTGWVELMRGHRRPWRHVTLDVAQCFRELTAAWPDHIIRDRAGLRILLYRRHAI